MEKPFVLPAVTFLSGVGLWILFFVLRWTHGWAQAQGAGFELAAGLLVGGLVLVSAIACQKADGPRLGGWVRGGVLLVLGVLTLWKAGTLTGGMLLAAALAIGIGTLRAHDSPEAAED